MLTKMPLRLRVALFTALGLVMAGLLATAFFGVAAVHLIPHGVHAAHRSISTATTAEPYIKLSLVTAGGLIIMLAVGAGASYLIAVHALKPVAALAESIDAMGDRALFGRVHVSIVNDEVSRLGRSFNTMMGRLEQSFDHQRLFALNAAHELKTPLAAIITNLEVLQLGDGATVQEYAATVDNVLSDAYRLNGLVRDLLNLHKELDPDRCEEIDVAAMFNEIIALLKGMAAVKNVHIEQRLSGVRIYGDRELIYRVFFNLVENAVKYNKPRGRVDIQGCGDTSQSIVHISDTGMGIAEQDLTQIFEPFYRVEPSRSRELGGSGLGLAIAKSIVERHRGHISMESVLGRGSVVTVALPDLNRHLTIDRLS